MMTDEKPTPDGNGEPPKISLNGKGNGNGNGKSDTGPVPPSTDAPPKVSIPVGRPSEPKAATSRIDLSEAVVADKTMPIDETTSIPVGIPSAAKSQTSRIDLADAAPPRTGIPSQRKKDTARVSFDDSQPIGGATRPVDLSAGAGVTSTTSGTVGVDMTTPVDDNTSAISMEIHDGTKTPQPIALSDLGAAGTMAIETDNDDAAGDDQLNASIDESYKAAHQSTMRIELDDAGKTSSHNTDRVEPALEDAEKASGTTARIDLSEVLGAEGDDVFKRRTGPMEAEEGFKPASPGTGSPKTIRIKKADAPVPTRILKRAPQSAPGTAAEMAKSGTAKIDASDSFEPSGPPTQRKTIRIKRPDGAAAAKPMTVARPAESGKRGRARRAGEQAVGAPGMAYTILAGVAVLVACVVVYVLAAQLNSIALGKDTTPSLPYYGRIL